MHFNKQSDWECFPETHPLLQLLLLGKGPLLHPPVPLSPPHLHLPWEKPPYYVPLLQLHNQKGADVENPSSFCVLSVTCVLSYTALICDCLDQTIVEVMSIAYPQISLASLTKLPRPLLLDMHSFALLMHTRNKDSFGIQLNFKNY